MLIYLGRKQVIHFHLQLHTNAFLRRKAVEKPFAAQTPPRKRGYVEDFALSITFFPYKTFTKVTTCVTTVRPYNLWQNRRATGARIWGSVQSFCFFGASVIFYIVKQSTGQTFLPSSLTRDDFYKC